MQELLLQGTAWLRQGHCAGAAAATKQARVHPWKSALLLQVERLDDGDSTMQQLPRRPSDSFEVEQGTTALLARPAEVPGEDVDDVLGPGLDAAGEWSSHLVKVSGCPVCS